MKTKSIVKKYDKLSNAYGKAASAWVEAWELYRIDQTEERKKQQEEASVELESARMKFYSFAEQEWK